MMYRLLLGRKKGERMIKENEKRKMIERGPGYRAGMASMGKSINARTISNALISVAFAYTGPAILAFQAGQDAGFTSAQMISWISSIYIFGGVLSFILATYYKMPIVGAWSIPGVMMVGNAVTGFSFNEASGAFLIAGIIVLLLGVTGLVGYVMDWIPLPIVMSMIAGAFMKYGVGLVNNTKTDLIVGLCCIGGYLVMPFISKKVPPVMGSLILGIGAAVIGGKFHFAPTDYQAGLMFVVPKFNTGTILSVSVPLAALVIGAENAQAIGVLKGHGYPVPINAMTIASGIGGIVTAFFGGHNANIAGPMTAIIADESSGNKDLRYGGAILNGFAMVAFGLFAAYALGIVSGLPSALVSLLAGLSMINLLINALKDGFGTGEYRTGAFTAFVIAMSGLTIFGIGSSFWGLLGGVLVAMIVDQKDFKAAKIRGQELKMKSAGGII